MDLDLWVLKRVHVFDSWLAQWAEDSKLKLYLYEFFRFVLKQAWACLFGALLLLAIVGTYLFYPAGSFIARYDILVVVAILLQFLLLYFKLETWDEARVILVFHIVGTLMEIFKTSVGSWIYPEPSVLRLWGVPLFTGFMYASVGSYIVRCSRLFDFQFKHHPSNIIISVLSVAIYVNFFTHHYFYDMRYLLFGVSAVAFLRTRIYFKVWEQYRSMPLLIGFMLVALFIWIAENIGTFTSVWVYPNQQVAWHPVSLGKLGSWFLLVIISYTLAYLNALKRRQHRVG